MRQSEESTRKQLALARRQGEAPQDALEAMDEESDSGVVVQRSGDYEIGLAVEEAEGMWEWHGGELVWQNPKDENCHVEVCVRDNADGRFVPGIEVTVTLTADDGNEIGSHVQPFLWHPWLYHYGRNWQVPGTGELPHPRPHRAADLHATRPRERPPLSRAGRGRVRGRRDRPGPEDRVAADGDRGEERGGRRRARSAARVAAPAADVSARDQATRQSLEVVSPEGAAMRWC